MGGEIRDGLLVFFFRRIGADKNFGYDGTTGENFNK